MSLTVAFHLPAPSNGVKGLMLEITGHNSTSSGDYGSALYEISTWSSKEFGCNCSLAHLGKSGPR